MIGVGIIGPVVLVLFLVLNTLFDIYGCCTEIICSYRFLWVLALLVFCGIIRKRRHETTKPLTSKGFVKSKVWRIAGLNR